MHAVLSQNLYGTKVALPPLLSRRIETFVLLLTCRKQQALVLGELRIAFHEQSVTKGDCSPV